MRRDKRLQNSTLVVVGGKGDKQKQKNESKRQRTQVFRMQNAADEHQQGRLFATPPCYFRRVTKVCRKRHSILSGTPSFLLAVSPSLQVVRASQILWVQQQSVPSGRGKVCFTKSTFGMHFLHKFMGVACPTGIRMPPVLYVQ